MSNESDNKVLEFKRRRLQKLKEEQAVKGISTPPEVLIEIDILEAEIEQLRGTSRKEGPQPTISPPVTVPPIKKETVTPAPPPAQPTSQEKSGNKWWILVVVILVGLAGYVFFFMWNPSPEPQPGEFPYSIRASHPMGEPLPDAHIVIQPAERDHLEQWTNEEGLAVFYLDGSFDGVPAIVLARKEGFGEREQEIMLYPEGYIEIPLEPMEP